MAFHCHTCQTIYAIGSQTYLVAILQLVYLQNSNSPPPSLISAGLQVSDEGEGKC